MTSLISIAKVLLPCALTGFSVLYSRRNLLLSHGTARSGRPRRKGA